MKSRIASAAIGASLLLSAGAAAAGTYQGVATYDGIRWQVEWSNVTPPCTHGGMFNVFVNSQTTAIIDGAPVNLSAFTTVMNSGNVVSYQPSVGGSLTKITVDGQTSVQCEGHTFLLPGHPPPASIPTLSEWAMILLGVALAGGAALTLHRRRTT